MSRIRAFVAEDEPPARAALRGLIEETPWLALVGEAADGRTAVAEVERLRPDLLFLDVEMPELSGLGVLDTIAYRPLVVFTTAYDRYAVAAFEVEALDYLVKPFGRRRFRETVERVRRALDAAAGVHVAGPAADGLPGAAHEALAGPPLRRLFVRSGRRITPLAVADVVRFEAEGDYVRAHLAGRSHLLHVALKELETLLEPGRFLRVHRSHLVQLDRVASLEESDDRRFQVVLDDGSRIVASRTGSRQLKGLIR